MGIHKFEHNEQVLKHMSVIFCRQKSYYNGKTVRNWKVFIQRNIGAKRLETHAQHTQSNKVLEFIACFSYTDMLTLMVSGSADTHLNNNLTKPNLLMWWSVWSGLRANILTISQHTAFTRPGVVFTWGSTCKLPSVKLSAGTEEPVFILTHQCLHWMVVHWTLKVSDTDISLLGSWGIRPQIFYDRTCFIKRK